MSNFWANFITKLIAAAFRQLAERIQAGEQPQHALMAISAQLDNPAPKDPDFDHKAYWGAMVDHVQEKLGGVPVEDRANRES